MKKMKGISSILLSICLMMTMLIFSAPAAKAAGSGKLGLSVDKATANPGDTITVTISIKENPGLTTIAVYAKYDTSAFEFVSKSVGSLLAENTAVQDTAGSVGFDLGDDMATTNVTSTGTIATFVLKVKEGIYNGNYSISINSVEAYDKDIASVSFDKPSLTVAVNGGACNHSLVKTDAVAATCEIAGNIEYYTCSICHKLFSDAAATHEITQESTVIAALGHAWDEGTVTTPATCTEPGVITYTCQNDPTHTTTEEIPALGHSWDDGVVTTNASVDHQGVITHTCTVCGATETENFDVIYNLNPVINSLTDEKTIAKFEDTISGMQGFSTANTKYYDVTIKVSVDNGATFIDITQALIPADGIKIILPYPSGTNASNYDFKVLHLLADNTIENLTPTEKAEGLEVTVKGFSPYAICFKQVSQPTPAPTPAPTATPEPTTATVASPKTSDSGNGMLLILLIATSIMLAGACVFYKKIRK